MPFGMRTEPAGAPCALLLTCGSTCMQLPRTAVSMSMPCEASLVVHRPPAARAAGRSRTRPSAAASRSALRPHGAACSRPPSLGHRGLGECARTTPSDCRACRCSKCNTCNQCCITRGMWLSQMLPMWKSSLQQVSQARPVAGAPEAAQHLAAQQQRLERRQRAARLARAPSRIARHGDG